MNAELSDLWGQMKARSASPAGDTGFAVMMMRNRNWMTGPEMDDSRDVLKMGRSGPIIAEMKAAFNNSSAGVATQVHSPIIRLTRIGRAKKIKIKIKIQPIRER